MEIYKNFSEVYDRFMDNIPYEKWIKYIKKIWFKNNLTPNTILDLCCGTGIISNKLALEGYKVYGVDISNEMLSIAQHKANKLNLENVFYINQDIRKLNTDISFDCVLSLCDSINYILKENELLKTFQLVYKHLNKKGLFIFDINTIYKFKNILSYNSFCETREDCAYTCENYFDKKKMINEFYTNFFIKDKDSNLYHRFEEIHYEKAYSISQINNLLLKNNFRVLGIYNDITFNSIKPNSERAFFVSQKI